MQGRLTAHFIEKCFIGLSWRDGRRSCRKPKTAQNFLYGNRWMDCAQNLKPKYRNPGKRAVRVPQTGELSALSPFAWINETKSSFQRADKEFPDTDPRFGEQHLDGGQIIPNAHEYSPLPESRSTGEPTDRCCSFPRRRASACAGGRSKPLSCYSYLPLQRVLH
jgi:hypothetical protein